MGHTKTVLTIITLSIRPLYHIILWRAKTGYIDPLEADTNPWW